MPSDQSTTVSEEVGEKLHDLAAEVKPRLRGWLHAGVMPLAVAGGVVLVALSPTTGTRIAAAVFMLTAMLLFGVSAIYHTGTWTAQTKERLKRFDHANIFLLIAGSYTPFTTQRLEGGWAIGMTTLVWGMALGGVVCKLLINSLSEKFWVGAYIAFAWVAVLALKPLLDGVSLNALILLALGGGIYMLGVRFFMHHALPFRRAVWHGFVVVAAAVQYAAVWAGVVLAPTAV